ncbi:MAG: hypothetical protein U0936_11550 [Planctomycetaceae bacterium]
MLTLFAVPILAMVTAFALRHWFGLPAWAVAMSPLLGLGGLFAIVGVLVWFDDQRRK